MSASELQRPDWLDQQFWDRLDRLESQHRRIQGQHDAARRGLEQFAPNESEELRAAWRRYCDVIAELDRSAAEFEVLRSGAE
jgi:hypothetical protein